MAEARPKVQKRRTSRGAGRRGNTFMIATERMAPRVSCSPRRRIEVLMQDVRIPMQKKGELPMPTTRSASTGSREITAATARTS